MPVAWTGANTPLDNRSQFRTLRDVASLINSSGDLKLTLDHLVFAACQNAMWSMGSVMSVDQKSGYAYVVTRHDPNLLESRLENRWKLATSPSLVALTRNEPVVIPDACVSDEFPGYRQEAAERGYRTVVIMPMGCADADGRSMVLTVQSRDLVDVTDDDLTFLGTVVHLGAIAVDKSHRLRADRLFTERLQTALSVHSSLMSQVLADGSVTSATAMISQLFLNPILAIDFSANLAVSGRSPKPDRYDDLSWQAAVRTTLSRQLMKAARASVDAPQSEARVLLFDDGREHFKISAKIEPLVVDGESVGVLMVFPRGQDFGDLDYLLLESAKFALSVQMMRSFIRFQTESQTLAELFAEILERRWRDPDDITAKALRLGVDLSQPAQLIAISLPDSSKHTPGLSVELQRSVARVVQQQHRQASVLSVDGVVICHVMSLRAERNDLPGNLMRRIVEEAGRILDGQPIIVESKSCQRLDDYPSAWEQCRRVIELAHRFGRRGALTADDFGPFPVLLAAANASEVRSFVDSSIGAVARHDDGHGTDYLHTLARYLECGCRNQACADAMGLHVTTLRYRLSRIHELFGIEIDTQERRFSLELAIRLRAMVSDTPTRV